MKIYTRTGDKGTTSLFDGSRVPKTHPRVLAFGTLDECNSILGVVVSFLSSMPEVKEELLRIQHDLFFIGSFLADPTIASDAHMSKTLTKREKEMEAYIDMLTQKLPLLRQFILPGGGRAGSFLHMARTIARRAEREIVSVQEKAPLDPSILVYINRLSDLLFTTARFVNHAEGKEEVRWEKQR